MHAVSLDPAAPMLAALARAPQVQGLTPEERAELDEIKAEMAEGQFVRHEDVPAALEAMHRAEHGGE
jgi:predicted transcriptional regulator